jgi:acetyltransferase
MTRPVEEAAAGNWKPVPACFMGGDEVLAGRRALSAALAIEVAARIGYPAAMKIVSRHLLHKTGVGGVKLNPNNAEQVRDAYDLMMLRIPQRAPLARLDGVSVKKMFIRGREVILGMTRDPQSGPMLMFGLGGIFVEVLKDVAFHLAPLTADEAMQMRMATRSYAILRGARGQADTDLEGIAGGLQRISQRVTDFPQIRELNINPLLIGDGGGTPRGGRREDHPERLTGPSPRRPRPISRRIPAGSEDWVIIGHRRRTHRLPCRGIPGGFPP